MTPEENVKATENLDAALAKVREAAIAALDAKIEAMRVRAVTEARARHSGTPFTAEEREAYSQAEENRHTLSRAEEVAWNDARNAVDDLKGYGR